MIGATLGQKYEIIRLLGAGGMGSVYEAREVGTGDRVAVKVIHDRLLVPDSNAPSRFRREARAAAAVDSEHIVQFLDAGEDEEKGTLYIALEYLDGEDLQTLIDRVGPIRPEAVLRIAGQALTGLQKAHQAGIVHRDIKPANLFLARGEGGKVTVKILDFGIAKIAPEMGGGGHTSGLTQTGGLLGSPLYMSPEQVQNSRDVDARSDLWSLGSALYCALASRAPQQDAEGVGKLIFTICASPAKPIRTVAPWVPPELASVVHATLEIEPSKRCPTAGAMLEAIRALAPDGFALREEMLGAMSAPERRPRDEEARHGRPLERTMASAPPATAWSERASGETAASAEPASAEPAAAEPAAAETTASGETGLVEPSPAPRGDDRASGPRPPRARAWALSAVGAAVVLGVGVAAAYDAGRSRAAPAASAASASASVARMTAASAPAPATSEGPRRVRLVVIPTDAEVEIDGARADVKDGLVEITGALGSTHRVRVAKRSAEALAEVTITEMGAQPLKVEIAPRAVEAAAPRPAGSVAKPHPLGSSAAAPPPVPSASAPPPKSTEDLLAPDRFR